MSERKKTVRLKATGKQDYNGRVVLVGEEFEASEEDAEALCNHSLGGLGLAVRVEEPSKARYARRDLRVEE